MYADRRFSNGANHIIFRAFFYLVDMDSYFQRSERRVEILRGPRAVITRKLLNSRFLVALAIFRKESTIVTSVHYVRCFFYKFPNKLLSCF